MKKTKIGLLMQGNSDWIGGIIYIQNLVKALSLLPAKKREKFSLHLLISPRLEPKFYENIKSLVEETHIIEESLLYRLRRKLGSIFIPWFKDKKLAKLLQTKEIDFFYPIIRNLLVSWDFPCDWSAWIPDFQHQHLPNFFSSKEIKARDLMFKNIADNSPKVVLSSRDALRDFDELYPESQCEKYVLNFRSIPEKEWFEKDSAPYEIQRKYNLPDNFFIISNQFWVHKNHKVVIEALSILKQKNIKPIIVCTGKNHDHRFPKYGDEILDLISQKDLANQFIILGLIPRFDQIQLMRRSLAVIQPSLFEGWSTVVEDARVLGKVMILSDIPVHIEQNPPGAIFFKRDSSQELSRQIEFLLPKLTPGPNLSSELEARERNILECQTYGEKFLDIIQTSTMERKKIIV